MGWVIEQRPPLSAQLRALAHRGWRRVRYGKWIAPGTWSRGSDFGRALYREQKAGHYCPVCSNTGLYRWDDESRPCQDCALGLVR